MLSIPTTWRRNAINIDTVELMTSSHPMYTTNFLHEELLLIFTETMTLFHNAKKTRNLLASCQL